MNVLIVENANDQYFVEALAKKVSVENKVVHIDDYKHCSLSEPKLTETIQNQLLDVNRGVSKIGIILDIDDETIDKRLSLINKCLKQALLNTGNIPPNNVLLTGINEFIAISVTGITVKVACFFTNVDGQGELETVLKAIKTKDSPFADCLNEGWRQCLESKGKKIGRRNDTCDISEKEILKLWVDSYKRFDTLTKTQRKQSEKNTDWKGIMLGVTKEGKTIEARGEEIFNLDSEILNELKEFLRMFD